MLATTRNIEIEYVLANEAEKTFDTMGLSLSDGISFILRQVIQQKSMPSERDEFKKFFNEMRARIVNSCDYLTEEEINAEIKASRAEKKVGNH